MVSMSTAIYIRTVCQLCACMLSIRFSLCVANNTSDLAGYETILPELRQETKNGNANKTFLQSIRDIKSLTFLGAD